MTGTGPPYPQPPAPGSNIIWTGYTIGVSPIGTIAPFYPWVTVIVQYANSPIIDALITSFNAACDLTKAFDDFYSNQWNPPTAYGYGLDVIGRIVNVSRVVQLPPGAEEYLGFQETGDPTRDVGFGQGPFYSGQPLTSNYNLDDADFKTLIYAKMLSNICDGSIPSINALLLTLFPNMGACYVVDGLDMTMSYNFAFALTGQQLAILLQSGVLPTPCGVASTIVQV
jgi:hypothetical protein